MAPKKIASTSRNCNVAALPELTEEELARIETVCKRLLSKTDGNADAALIMGVEKAHYSIPFLHRMITVHGADGKAAALHFYDKPPVLEMLVRTGHVDLRFNNDEILLKAVENGLWQPVDYLINFVGADPAKEEYFRRAIELGSRDLFSVLLNGLNETDAVVWDTVGKLLIEAQAWQMITDVWRTNKVHFRRILQHSDLLKEALKAGANYLSFCSIRMLAAENIFPVIGEDESKPNRGLMEFVVKQLSALRTAQLKKQQQEEEEELAPQLKPSALNAYQKSDF